MADETYRAFRIHEENGVHRAGIETLERPEPRIGEVLIRVRYSSVNYKDALAGTGKGKILRQFPLIGGIDACGEVIESKAAGFSEGDLVIVTGYELSASHDGGYADWLCVPGGWVVPMPHGMGPFQAMALGTAGFTAALAIERMEANGLKPDNGPVVVTGASGGVGCLAVDMLALNGYQVTAVSGKPDQVEFLKTLGATEIIGRDNLPGGDRPLEKGVWAGAVDNVGGDTLAKLTRTMQPWSSIASIGMAGGIELNTTVMPFIIRGVNLLGINSQGCPMNLRQKVWQRLANDLHPKHLEKAVSRVIGLKDLPEVFDDMLAGKTHGRIVVQLSD